MRTRYLMYLSLLSVVLLTMSSHHYANKLLGVEPTLRPSPDPKFKEAHARDTTRHGTQAVPRLNPLNGGSSRDGGTGAELPTPIDSGRDGKSEAAGPLADETAMSPRACITNLSGTSVPSSVLPYSVLYFSGKSATHGDKPRSIQWRVRPPSIAANSVALRSATDADGLDLGPVIVIQVDGTSGTLEVDQIASLGDESSVETITITLPGLPTPNPVNPDKPVDPVKPTPVPSTIKTLLQKVVADTAPLQQRKAVATALREVADRLRAPNSTIDSIDMLLVVTTNTAVQKLGGINLWTAWYTWRDKFTDTIRPLKLPLADHAAVWDTMADCLEMK